MTMGDDDPRGVANLDPRGMIGRIYVEYHLTLLHTKYTRSPKGNDRSPESKQVFLNSSQVSKRFFQLGKGS